MISYGFVLGTFKYLFAQWLMVDWYYRVLESTDYSFLDVFLPSYIGAVVTMSIFYWGSEYFIKRSAKKKTKARQKAELEGEIYVPKKNFTFVNKLLVKIRKTLGIYGLTFLAPLFLSIPGGSVVCAKFFGDQKKTFPLMLIFTAVYGAGMTIIFMAIYD